jgi:hypothetical protein
MHGLTRRLGLCFWLLSACAEGSPATPANRSRGADVRSSDDESEDQGGMEVVDAAPARRVRDAGEARAQTSARSSDAGARDAEARDAGTNMSRNEGTREQDAGARDAGSPDSGMAAAPPEPPPPPPVNTGSCCSAGAGTGCGDPALQECVCALSPRCCSDAWDDSCARLVREKNCQSGVRDCVCGNGEGQWQQAYCCEGGWNATCESVSIHKCGATEACP